MQSRSQRILAKIIQTKQRGKTCAPHTAHQRPFLRVKTIRPDSLMPQQMKRFIFITVVGLLEHCHIIYSALMQILIFIRIHRIDLDSDIPEIFPGDLHRLSYIFHVGILPALAGQN